MTTSCAPAARPVRRRLSSLAVLAATALLSPQFACGTQNVTKPEDPGAGNNAGGVNFSGSVRAFVQPTTTTTPAFNGVSAALVGYEALADPSQTTPATLGQGPVQSAAASCMADGCEFRLQNVVLGETTRGLFVRPEANSVSATGQWQPVYALVANSNQVALSRTQSGAVTAFAPATLPSVASVANLARLAGLSRDELLARGATLAFVSPSRDVGDTFGGGVENAYLTLTAGPAGAQVLYPTDDYQNVRTNGTNHDGAALVVGPAAKDAATRSYAYPVAVAAPGAALTFVDIAVFVRPGALVLHTLLPIR